jgi:hypothetical protein
MSPFVFKVIINLTEILLNKHAMGIMAAHYEIIDSTHSVMLHAVQKVHVN